MLSCKFTMAQIDVKQAAGFFLAGSIAGAAIALLYAPQNGSKTTADIGKAGRRIVNRFDDLQENVRDQVAGFLEDMTGVVKDGIDHGKKLGAEGYEEVLQGFDKAKKCVEDGRIRLEKIIKTA